MTKDNLRMSIGMILIVSLSIGAYVFIPFIYIYGVAVTVSLIAMITDYIQKDPKKGMIIHILKWTTLIPAINLVPLLLIPVFSVTNLFFKNKTEVKKGKTC